MPGNLSCAGRQGPLDLEGLRRLCEEANAPERGELLDYCAAHDYGDPGYPPSDCSACVFERDAARNKLAIRAMEVVPVLLDEVERLRKALSEALSWCLDECCEAVQQTLEDALKGGDSDELAE